MFQKFLDSVQNNHLKDHFIFTSEVDLVRPILKDETFRNSCTQWFKSLQKARNERLVNNGTENTLPQIRKCKNLLKKYHLCNRSLIYLNTKSKSFEEIWSKIYYERANVLIKTENYHEALESLLMMNDTSEIKVVYRMALCAFKTNDGLMFENKLSQLKALYVEPCSDNIKEELEKYRGEYEKLLTKNIVIKPERKGDINSEYLEKFTDFSLKITPEKGRHIVSNEKIEDNTKLLTENAFAFVSLRPTSTSFADCQTCAKTNIIPVFCKMCKAGFCCINCMLNHKYECKGSQLSIWHEIGIAYLAFKSFIIGFPQFCALFDESFSGKNLDEILESAVEVEFNPEKDQYRLLLSLETHFEDMLQGDLVTFALTACALILYLEIETTFFKDENVTYDTEKWEVLAASMVLRQIGQMVCNAHTMSDVRVEYEGDPFPPFKNISLLKLQRSGLTIKNEETFAGIFPFISLLNHSCKPNIINRFNGHQLTISAKGIILNNDEIQNNYGINNLRISRVDRQSALEEQYHFTCKCEECLKPEDSYLLLQKLCCNICSNLLDANFEMETMEVVPRKVDKCRNCGSSFDIEQFEKMIKELLDNTEDIRKTNTLSKVLRALEFCRSRLNPYHEVIYFFSKTLINSVGDFALELKAVNTELKETAENMLNICKYLYGKNSVEYLLDRVCAVNILSQNDTEVFELAKIVLSDQSCQTFQNIYKVIAENAGRNVSK